MTFVVASGARLLRIELSTYALIAFTLGYFKSELPSTATSNDLFAKASFKSNADCVAVEIGLFKSLVLSTLPKPIIALVIPLTVPVKDGELIFAFSFKIFCFKSRAFWTAVEIGLSMSLVLSTLPKPTIDLLIPLTIPVNVGEAIFAFASKAN